MKDMFRKLQLFAEEGAQKVAQVMQRLPLQKIRKEHRAIRMDPEKLNRDRNRKKKYTDEDVDRIIAKKIAAERKKNVKAV